MFDEGDKATIKLTVSEAVKPLVDKLNDHHTQIVVIEKDVEVLDKRADKAKDWQKDHLKEKHSPLKTVRNIGAVALTIIAVSSAIGIILGVISCTPGI